MAITTVTAREIKDLTITDADVAAANKDGTAGTASLRTLGTGATQAAAGNDSRLSDSRAPTVHALYSAYHSGLLDNSQATQFLLTDGTRALTGNLAVAAGVTIDGVDISTLPTFQPTGANPTGLIGMTAVNGSAITFTRSDSTHAIDPAIAPTWTAKHIFPAGVNGAQLGDFTNSNHTHLSVAQGGGLSAAAITSGILAVARGGTGADMSATGGAGQYVKQAGVGAAFTVGAFPAGDIASGLVALARGGTNADLSGTGAAGSYLKQSSAGAAISVAGILDADLPSTILRTSRILVAGAGLTGGGDLSIDRAFNVGAGLGITVNADDVAINFGYAATWTALHTFNAGIAIAAGQAITFGADTSLSRKAATVMQMGSGNAWQSSSFTSGFAGFAINDIGNAEFNNITARGEFHASVFAIGEMRVDAGTDIIAKSGGVLFAQVTTV